MTSIILQIDSDIDEFLDIVFNFLKNKTEFGLNENEEAKRIVMLALKKHMPFTDTDCVTKQE